MSVLERLGRFNAEHPWSHNDAFRGFVMRHPRAVRRRGGDTALDVGCGTGRLAGRLSQLFPNVIGIEPDRETALLASRNVGRGTVRVEARAFGGEPDAAYDVIAFVASIHHMPLRAALLDARAALRPSGSIVIVGVAKESERDRWRSVVSLVLNPIVGFVRHPRRAAALPENMRAPAVEAAQTFEEIEAVVRELLPGVRMRRRLFWRYTAIWTDDASRRSRPPSEPLSR